VQALAYVRQTPDPALRSALLSSLLDHLPQELHEQAYWEAWDATRSSPDSVSKIYIMFSLAGKTSPGDRFRAFHECFAAIASINDDWVRAKALVRILPNIPARLLTGALEVAQTIDKSGARLLSK
jgi:hypothetical protein